jgi:hypothetical protein
MPMTIDCEVCGTPFTTSARSRARGQGRFCGHRCRGVWDRSRTTPAERFWAKVDRSGGYDACWLWTGDQHEHGYGRMWVPKPDGSRGFVYAHRFSWEAAHGAVPEGLSVLHRCDNPPCCNPAHLFVGTQAANNADRDDKDRVRHGDTHRNARLTAKAVREIRAIYGTGAVGMRRLAALYEVSAQTISDVVHGKTWRRA